MEFNVPSKTLFGEECLLFCRGYSQHILRTDKNIKFEYFDCKIFHKIIEIFLKYFMTYSRLFFGRILTLNMSISSFLPELCDPGRGPVGFIHPASGEACWLHPPCFIHYAVFHGFKCLTCGYRKKYDSHSNHMSKLHRPSRGYKKRCVLLSLELWLQCSKNLLQNSKINENYSNAKAQYKSRHLELQIEQANYWSRQRLR